MIRVRYEPEDFRLRIRGHACAGAKGEDIVCAAVSALGWTLVDAALDRVEFGASCELREKEGLMDIRCRPAPSARAACRFLLETVLRGLRRIAEQYPQYVEIEEG